MVSKDFFRLKSLQLFKYLLFTQVSFKIILSSAFRYHLQILRRQVLTNESSSVTTTSLYKVPFLPLAVHPLSQALHLAITAFCHYNFAFIGISQKWIIQSVFFCVWVLPLSITLLRFRSLIISAFCYNFMFLICIFSKIDYLCPLPIFCWVIDLFIISL